MGLHRLRHRGEDDAGLGQLFLEGRDHRDGVEHGIDRDPALEPRTFYPCEHLLLGERDAEALIGPEQLWIDLREVLRPLRALRCGIVIELLEVDLGVVNIGPSRLFQGEPAAIGLEPPGEQPIGLALLGRDEPDHVLVQALRRLDRLDLGGEAVFVLVDVDLFDASNGFLHGRHVFSPFVLTRPQAAALGLSRPISSPKALRKLLISVFPVAKPRLTRIAPWRSSSATPIAASTCEASTLPEEQALPELTAM